VDSRAKRLVAGGPILAAAGKETRTDRQIRRAKPCRSIDTNMEDGSVVREMERRDAQFESAPASGCTLEELETELFGRK